MRYRESARSARPSAHRKTVAVIAAGCVAAVALIAVVWNRSSSATTGSGADSPGPALPSSVVTYQQGQAGGVGGTTDGKTGGKGDSGTISDTVWPASGQAAFVESGQSAIQAGPHQHPAPIASVTKVMTAYLVLNDHPLRDGQDGPTITLTGADVADTAARRAKQESLVAIAAGERLTERQALEALLLPSANNIAAVLARWDASSSGQFVQRMNDTARALGMSDTRYTDPSGFEPTTVSTAADQVRLVDQAMSIPAFAEIVAMPSASLPVAGTVRNTDTLLGRDGFVGVKTGSDNAAGGCFAFRAVRTVDGRQTTITGVVLGQPGEDQIGAGLRAADGMVNRIASG